jgi:hypothetical protein
MASKRDSAGAVVNIPGRPPFNDGNKKTNSQIQSQNQRANNVTVKSEPANNSNAKSSGDAGSVSRFKEKPNESSNTPAGVSAVAAAAAAAAAASEDKRKKFTGLSLILSFCFYFTSQKCL